MTISATWTAPSMKKAMAGRASIWPGTAASAPRTGTASSSMIVPVSTANSGTSASITAAFSQPVNRPRVPLNSAMTTKIGPSATSTASAMRAVTSTPTVPSMNSIAPSHSMPSGENAETSAASPCAASTAAKTTSTLPAKVAVAEPLSPVRTPASQSGAPMVRFHTTL